MFCFEFLLRDYFLGKHRSPSSSLPVATIPTPALHCMCNSMCNCWREGGLQSTLLSLQTAGDEHSHIPNQVSADKLAPADNPCDTHTHCGAFLCTRDICLPARLESVPSALFVFLLKFSLYTSNPNVGLGSSYAHVFLSKLTLFQAELFAILMASVLIMKDLSIMNCER